MRLTTQFALAALGSSCHAALLASRDDLVECLRSSLSSEAAVYVPGDPGFVLDTTRFSSHYSPSFSVVSAIANEDDARASIICAKENGVPFLFTGTGHGFYTGLEELRNGLEIYTAAFYHVDVDAEADEMTIGSSAVFKNISGALQAVGKNIPVGGGPCVGMVGASLGAGIGRLQGLYGTMADSLLSVRLMLPNTTVIEVSETSNQELFWGLRGAGFNFGFVLNATYRVYDAPAGGTNLNADFEFPLSSVRDFYQALHDNIDLLPAPLCVTTAVGLSSTQNATTLQVNAVYAGPEDEGREAVQFIEALGTQIRQNYTQIPWNTVTENGFFLNGSLAVDTCHSSQGRRDPLGIAVNQIDVDASVEMTEQFNYLVTTYPQMSASDNSAYFCAKQGVVARPDNATAYPWRHAVGHQTWGILYGDNTTEAADIENLPEKMRGTIASTAGTDYLNVYVGFSFGNEPLESIWSEEHLPRLVALKNEFDPEGLFSNYHPIPTSL